LQRRAIVPGRESLDGVREAVPTRYSIPEVGLSDLVYHKNVCLMLVLMYNKVMETKPCKTCNETKPLDEYYLLYGKPESHCKKCRNKKSYEKQREYRLLYKYGLTRKQYKALLTLQGDVCAICKQRNEVKELGVDHDHTTGRVRGLLCNDCNIALGYFKDNIDYLRQAILYLTASQD
jgi:hypothetical protein